MSNSQDRLRQIDLNLLVTLEALLVERNVTRAAKRLHLSQPSVSVQLRKLREIFTDPLLSPAPGGMTPTTKALTLLPQLRAALEDMRSVLEPRPAFDATQATLTWHIAAADYAQHAVLMPFLARMSKIAPGIRIGVRESVHSRMTRQLESGAIDVGLLALDAVPDKLHSLTLYREDYVLIARRRHPAFKRKLTLDTFCKLDFVLVSPDGGGFRGITDTILESRGRKRRVALSVPNFLVVPEIVARSNLVAMFPSRIADRGRNDLQIVAPPLQTPSFEMAMVWHDRWHADPAHTWLREQISSAYA